MFHAMYFNMMMFSNKKPLVVLLFLQLLLVTGYAQEFTDDAKINAGFLKSVDSLLSRVKTVTMEDAKKALGAPSLSVAAGLVKPSTKPIPANVLYEKAKKATVVVGCIYLCPRCSNTHISESSGYVIDPKGMVVTNYHVAATYANMSGGNKPLGFTVRMEDGTTYAVQSILTASKRDDLALLQLETGGAVLPALALGKPARTGDEIFVLGHPKGMHYFFSRGHVVNKYMEEVNGDTGSFFREMMAISADYATGSSGGPVMDVYGNIVGTVSNTRMLLHSETNQSVQMVVKNTVPVESLLKLVHQK